MAERDFRGQLTGLRHGLLRLHKTLLDWERGIYERDHGRQTGGELLKLLLDDPHFAWLRPISQTIVRIDEMLDGDEPLAESNVSDVFATARTLTSPEGPAGQGTRYQEALQSNPDIV